jgi:hypothetical protein
MANVNTLGTTGQAGSAKQTLTPQQRAILFAQATRQNYQTMPTQAVNAENTTIQFNLPKVRLLSRILLHVEAVATLTSTAATIATSAYSPYNIIRRISLDLNNGFSPLQLSGQDLSLYNRLRLNGNFMDISTNGKANTYVENVAAGGGHDCQIRFTMPLEVVLNQRDQTGYILLQNDESVVTLTIDISTLSQAYVLNAGNGDTVTFKSLKITPTLETYSIPNIPQAFPDLSVLKLVSSKSDIFQAGATSVIKLPVGTIYRKMILKFVDNNGVALTDQSFTGNIDIVINQADTPYSIQPQTLSALNHMEFGEPLPSGTYVWDFSDQGIPNFGGSMNYIDSEKITEFWIRFNANVAGTVTVISENLARLQS